jgi:putative membrane protein
LRTKTLAAASSSEICYFIELVAALFNGPAWSRARKMAEQRQAQLSDYLAAERTFLAWIRTGLALMGFGFVVARFGLFLQLLQVRQPGATTPPTGLSLWFGTALIILGVVVDVASSWRHWRLVQALDRGDTGTKRPSSLAIAVALIMAAVGVAMAIYLIFVRSAH